MFLLKNANLNQCTHIKSIRQQAQSYSNRNKRTKIIIIIFLFYHYMIYGYDGVVDSDCLMLHQQGEA